METVFFIKGFFPHPFHGPINGSPNDRMGCRSSGQTRPIHAQSVPPSRQRPLPRLHNARRPPANGGHCPLQEVKPRGMRSGRFQVGRMWLDSKLVCLTRGIGAQEMSGSLTPRENVTGIRTIISRCSGDPVGDSPAFPGFPRKTPEPLRAGPDLSGQAAPSRSTSGTGWFRAWVPG